GSLLLPSIALANYAPMIQNPNGGYLIQLSRNDGLIASTPVVGSDGKNYYRIGKRQEIYGGNDESIQMAGFVKCVGRTWGGESTAISANNAYHRLFIYPPLAGTTIEGLTAYRINSNVVMTVDSNMRDWTSFPAPATTCSNADKNKEVIIADFRVQFPIVVTFYIDHNIDGPVVIGSTALGGYVRAFMSPTMAPTFTSWPLEETTTPMRLLSSTLNVSSSCNTTTTTGQAGIINLRHGSLNTLNYDSVVTENVTYNCKFSKSTKVRLRLDYTTDGDPQKRLPMTSSQNSNNKIYSDLNMTDEITGQTGKDFKVDIKDLRTIKITSHIQGSNAVAGDYKGSAWLIATFD
ncbi:spore coat protein U domain-containing protein, partial [Providencia stuartii]|uniref:spore coat protein U domain-containing protein n=1 Tax=Providencia stuartii TaxID=588 RepID=UPI0028FCC842